MAATLKTAFTLTGLVIGTPVVTAHGLNWNPSRKVVPDFIALTESGYAVSADDTNITITRGPEAPATVTVIAESWHTYDQTNELGFGAATWSVMATTGTVT